MNALWFGAGVGFAISARWAGIWWSNWWADFADELKDFKIED